MKRIFQKLTALTLGLVVMLAVLAITPTAKAATSTSQAGIVSMSYGSLNVRSSASTGASILTKLPKGSYVTLISLSGSFWKVEYASGAYGYVSASYITKVSGASAASISVSAGSLNVRTGAGTSYPVKATLYSGKIVVVLSSSGGWSRILYNGTQLGFVNSSYLKSTGSKMVWPVPASAKVVQSFVGGSHLGIDIAPSVQGVAGDRIVAAAGGTVAYSGTLSGYGYVVYINSYYNGQYIQTRYAHMAHPPLVSAGNSVGAGQILGYMGKTGDATGVHLHFEVRVRSSSGACISNSESTPVNPLNYVSK